MRREAIQSEILHKERRVADLKGRMPLLQNEHFQRFCDGKRSWLEFVKNRLISQRTDEYTLGYLQGMAECLQDDILGAEEVTEKVQALSGQIRDLRKALQNMDDRNFRAPPPGGGYRQAPPGAQATGAFGSSSKIPGGMQ